MENLIIINRYDKTEIPAVFYKKKQESKYSKNFVFFHGLTASKDEYLDFYKNLAISLSMAGHNVVCFDSRAHGESNKTANEFTVTNLINDGIEVIKWLQNKTNNSKIYLFGTSFGAIPAISISFILPDIVDNLYLLAPVLDFNKLYIQPINKERAEKYKGLVNKTVLEGSNFNLTDNLFFNRQLVTEFSLISLPEIIKKIPFKVEIMHGTKDTMVPFQITKELVENSKNIILHIFPNMDHGFMEYGDDEGINSNSQDNIKRILNILSYN